MWADAIKEKWQQGCHTPDRGFYNVYDTEGITKVKEKIAVRATG
jgi:hypothetical protein